MDRRQFLTLSPENQETVYIPASGARTDTGINPYTGEFGTAQVVHLLKRTLFGATPADIAWCSNLTMDQAVDALLTPQSTAPSPPLNNYGNDETGVAPGTTWVNAAPASANEELDIKRRDSYKAWWIGVMLNQPRSIHEKMVLFWHNHFVTETRTVNDARYIYKYNTTLRQYALGNFKDFTKAITLDPAMLVYLNGNLNSKEAADENYARELHELFTVGKGPDSHYTEEDVRATARVLTGFRINSNTIQGYFEPTKHDITNKEFSSFYGNKKISGKTGPEGATELDDLLKIIFDQHEVARFICRKLYRFFVYYIIDDAAEQNVIAPLADIFRNNLFNIRPVLNALFKSEHFFDPLNTACLIKSPIDFCVGMCREFGVKFPLPSAYSEAYDAWAGIHNRAAGMLQNIGDPPLVSGWEAYYQIPLFHELWINTDTLPKRNQLSDMLITDAGYAGLKIDALVFADQLSDPSNPVTLVKDSLDILYRVDVSDNLLSFLKNNILLSGQSPNSDYYWTNAWLAWKGNPADANLKAVVQTRLQAMYKYIMDLSEYQLS